MTFLTQLRVVLLTSVLLFSMSAQASYMALMLGPKNESLEKRTTSNSRLNPASLIFEYGMKVYGKVYVAFSASGEFDLSTMSSVGFGLYGFADYYFIGSPDLIKTSGKDARLTLTVPYTLYGGVGLFQKFIRFDGDRDIEENLGGLGLSLGGSYDLSKRYFLVSQARFLLSGLGGGSSVKSYSSLELYLGMALRF